jgi:hypothetical protein
MSITLNPTFNPTSPVRVGRHSIDAPEATAPLLVLMPNYEPCGEARHELTGGLSVATIAARLRAEQPTMQQLAGQITSGIVGGQL